MNYNGKQLLKAREHIDAIRSSNENEHTRRISYIRNVIPEIADIDRELASQMRLLISLTLSSQADTSERIESLRQANLDLQSKKTELLRRRGFPADYLDEIFTCPLCHDTGFIGSNVCDCLKKAYNQELTKELSSLLVSGNECFDSFRLDYYDDQTPVGSDHSPRYMMEHILSACRKFADNFPNVSSDLLFQGSTGLGKTYLSACIAKTVSEKSYSVCYESAISALDVFEQQKFSRDLLISDNAAAKAALLLDCDLLILDDLGTELITAMTLSSLYRIINTRMINGKRTIISTNCSDKDLYAKYSPQIASRLLGEYLILRFEGSDIRVKKRKV